MAGLLLQAPHYVDGVSRVRSTLIIKLPIITLHYADSKTAACVSLANHCVFPKKAKKSLFVLAVEECNHFTVSLCMIIIPHLIIQTSPNTS